MASSSQHRKLDHRSTKHQVLLQTFPPIGSSKLGGYSTTRVRSFLQFLNLRFRIWLSPLADWSPPGLAERICDPRSLRFISCGPQTSSPPLRPKTFRFLGVAAGGTIERSCYSPHYVNTERDYERDYQAALPQGRTAADRCKPRHGRDDRKRERSFCGLSQGAYSSPWELLSHTCDKLFRWTWSDRNWTKTQTRRQKG